MLCHWKCWRQCWWGRYWCCIRGTLRVMTTGFHSNLESPGVLNIEHSGCCAQSPGTGIGLWPAGQNHQLLSGLRISWKSWSNVSTHSFALLFIHLHICTRLVVRGPFICTWDQSGLWRPTAFYLFWYWQVSTCNPLSSSFILRLFRFCCFVKT